MMPINQGLKFCCQTSSDISMCTKISRQASPIITIGAKISRQLFQLAAKFRPNYFNWRQNYSPIRLS
jgi:hypothetical protein